MKNNKISSIQFGSMLIMKILSTFLGVSVYSILKTSNVDAYLCPIIAGIIGIFLVYMFIQFLNYEEELPLDKKITKILGKKLGIIVNIIFVIIAVFANISVCYNLVSLIVSQFLTKTSPLIIGFVFSILLIILNNKGLDTLGRVAQIFIVIIFIMFIFSLIGLIPSVEIDNLKPFLANGNTGLIKGTIRIILYNLSTIFTLLIIPKSNIVDKNNSNKVVIISYIISILTMFLTIFFIISVLGIHLASYYQFPEYIMLKSINMLDFINRIENILVIQWILELFFTGTIIVYFIKKTILPNKNNNLLTSIITIGILFSAITLFKNNTIFNNYTYSVLPYIRLTALIILIILFVVLKIKTRKNKNSF